VAGGFFSWFFESSLYAKNQAPLTSRRMYDRLYTPMFPSFLSFSVEHGRSPPHTVGHPSLRSSSWLPSVAFPLIGLRIPWLLNPFDPEFARVRAACSPFQWTFVQSGPSSFFSLSISCLNSLSPANLFSIRTVPFLRSLYRPFPNGALTHFIRETFFSVCLPRTWSGISRRMTSR